MTPRCWTSLRDRVRVSAQTFTFSFYSSLKLYCSTTSWYTVSTSLHSLHGQVADSVQRVQVGPVKVLLVPLHPQSLQPLTHRGHRGQVWGGRGGGGAQQRLGAAPTETSEHQIRLGGGLGGRGGGQSSQSLGRGRGFSTSNNNNSHLHSHLWSLRSEYFIYIILQRDAKEKTEK